MNPEPTKDFDIRQMKATMEATREATMEATRDSALETVLTGCEKGMTELAKELAAIQEQLSPMLRPAPHVDSRPEPIENSSPAVDRLRAIKDDIRKSRDHLARLRENLDL